MKITWIKRAKPKPFLYKPVFTRMGKDSQQEKSASGEEPLRKKIALRWKKRSTQGFGRRSMLLIYILVLFILLLWIFNR